MKEEYSKLLLEKNMFAEKLDSIEQLGENLHWEDQSHILREAKPMIEATRNRLKNRVAPK